MRRIDWRLLLGAALPLALLLLLSVSLRWDFADGHPPAYGFPLPFTWWGGISSAAWQLDPVALLVDGCVYLAATLALSLLVARLAPPPGSAPALWARRTMRGALALVALVLFTRQLGLPLASGLLEPDEPPRSEARWRVWLGSFAEQ